mmetsp:Transcript_56878/g.106711  ORF Transcript_56878/g.106711 Transcript_56878/m.106711 type:complete len:125 (-) Transcript_56878:624-998(-)
MMHFQIDPGSWSTNLSGARQNLCNNVKTIHTAVKGSMILEVSHIPLQIRDLMTRYVRRIRHYEIEGLRTSASPIARKAVMNSQPLLDAAPRGIFASQFHSVQRGINRDTFGCWKSMQKRNDNGS